MRTEDSHQRVIIPGQLHLFDDGASAVAPDESAAAAPDLPAARLAQSAAIASSPAGHDVAAGPGADTPQDGGFVGVGGCRSCLRRASHPPRGHGRLPGQSAVPAAAAACPRCLSATAPRLAQPGLVSPSANKQGGVALDPARLPVEDGPDRAALA
jgi:hypothetical protein